MAEIISVSALNRYVKSLLDGNDQLFDVALRGEIANFVQNAKSGHCYFSLREGQSSVKALMFRGDARQLAFRPENGMQVIVRCRVTLYERDGAFQIYVNAMFPDGIGSAQLALEQRKRRLEAEGLFAPEHKKPLPSYPKAVGVITSKTGAALQDIKNVMGRRWCDTKLFVYPVRVQGMEAAEEIAGAIRRLDQSGLADVILVARGGGSREDLWVFNAECIARAAYQCKTPIVSAVGHEIDFTLLDFVADLRAPTPSAAAELVVPSREELKRNLCSLEENIRISMQKRLEICYNETKRSTELFGRCAAETKIAQGREELQKLGEAIRQVAGEQLKAKRQKLCHAAALADSLSPYKVLSRGYALVEGADGTPLPMEKLKQGEEILLCGSEYVARCLVQTVEKRNEST